MLKIKKIVFMCVCMLMGGVYASSVDVQSLLEEFVENNGGVGAAVGWIDHGKVSFFTCGKMRGEELITQDTIFEIGSITKVFTTLALMDRVADGKMQLDDSIENYLPGIKLSGNKITLRHLATHASGLPSLPDNFNPKNRDNPYEDYKVADLYKYLNHCTLKTVPGETCAYSNLGMGLLGHILSVQAGKSYEKLIQEVVCEQLGMKNTSMTLSPEMKDLFASGHHLGREVGHWDVPTLAGAGALRSNIKDMTQFLAANMGISCSPLVELMKQCHQQQKVFVPGIGVGLGWMLSRSDTAEIIWHNGGTGGFRSYLGFNPKTQTGVVILSNSSGDWPDEFGLTLLDLGFEKPLVSKMLENNSDYLKKFAGSYEVVISKDGQALGMEISVIGKRLVSILSSGEDVILYPESWGIFGISGSPVKVHFSFDDLGNASKIEAKLLDGAIYLQGKPK